MHAIYNMPLGYSPADQILPEDSSDGDTFLDTDDLFDSTFWQCQDEGVVRQVKTEVRIRLQADPGKNISLTGDRGILRHFRWILPKPVDGFTGTNGWTHCTGFGYLPLVCDDGRMIQVPMYYCKAAVETIFSPQYFYRSSREEFDSFLMQGSITFNDDSLRFDSPSGLHTVKVPLKCKNGLYSVASYRYLVGSCDEAWEQCSMNDNAKACHIHDAKASRPTTPQARLLAKLWHQRLGHLGEMQLK